MATARIKHIALIAAVLAMPRICVADGNIEELFPYGKNSQFVKVPGDLVGVPLALPGYIIGATLLCPFVALRSKTKVTARDYFLECSAGGAIAGFIAGRAVGGFPFYLIEESLWGPPDEFKTTAERKTGTVKNGRIQRDKKPGEPDE